MKTPLLRIRRRADESPRSDARTSASSATCSRSSILRYAINPAISASTPTGQQDDPRAVDRVAVEGALADLRDRERDGCQRQDEDDADHRLQQGEHAPAHLVVDIGAEQSVSREVGDAGAEADADDEHDRERDLRHDGR